MTILRITTGVALLAATLTMQATEVDTEDMPLHSDAPTHFCWGADVGGGVDMTGNNMSYIDISANFGYKNDLIKMLGVGAGLNVMVSNSCRSFPVYALFRTSFTTKPSLCFMELRTGASVNYLPGNESQTGLYLSGGLGVHLATGRTFSSHLVLSYSFFDRGYITHEGTNFSMPDLHYAGIRIGISF